MDIRSIFVAVVCFGLYATNVLAKLPNADDAKAYTAATYARDVLAFNKETLAGAYVRVGTTNPEWDAAAEKFLDAMAARFAGAGVSVLTQPPGQMPNDALLAAGKALLDDGCEDPLVMYCHAVVLLDNGQMDEGRPLLATAAERMMKSSYPLLRRLRAVDRWLDSIDDPNARPMEAKKFCAESLQQLATSPECKGIGRRVVLGVWREIWQDMNYELKGPIIEKLLADDKAERWLAHMVAGDYYIEAAWKSRGGGWANTVTEEGWAGFFKHLEMARDALEAAYEAEGNYPEAPTKMITVAMGAGDRLGINARLWFENAITAQLDFKPAFDAYMTAILPRWGGSHQAMFQVAVECAEADRFDTDLPFRFEEILDRIAEDDDPAFLATPHVYSVAAPVFEKLASRMPVPQHAVYHRTYKLAMEVKLRRYDDARKTLDAIKNEPAQPRPLSLFNLTADTVVGKVHAMTGPQRVAMLAIERRVLADPNADVLDDLRKVATDLRAAGETGLGTEFVEVKIAEREFNQAFAAGDWVTIQPGKSLAGWTKTMGDWTTNDAGELVAAATVPSGPGRSWRNGPLLTYNGQLGERFAVRATLSGDAWFGGILVAGIPPRRHAGAWFGQRGQTIDVGDLWKKDTPAIPVKESHELMIAVWDRTMTVTVDGKEMISQRPFEGDAEPQLTLNGLYPKVGRLVIYRNVQVKKLTEQP